MLGLTFLMFLSALNGAEVLEVFQKNCVQCHGKDGKVKGKVNLLEIADLDHLKGDRKELGHSRASDFKQRFEERNKNIDHWKEVYAK